MKTATESLQVELPRQAIDPSYANSFEEERQEIYKQTKPGPARQELLTELTDLADLAPEWGEYDGSMSVHAWLRRAIKEGQIQANGERYRVTLDDSGEEVIDLSLIKIEPEDELATARVKRMSAMVPSGPKKNQTSFRTDPSRVPPKGHRKVA